MVLLRYSLSHCNAPPVVDHQARQMHPRQALQQQRAPTAVVVVVAVVLVVAVVAVVVVVLVHHQTQQQLSRKPLFLQRALARPCRSQSILARRL
jgi:hypothetical protein